jgi:meiotically up-regulated gene 157 (Mug157) protein
MKALTFMIQREQEWLYEESQNNIWAREVDANGELMFVNGPSVESSLTMPVIPIWLPRAHNGPSLENREAAS